MNRFVWARSGMAAAVALVVAAGGHVGVANAADDGLALKMASSVRDRVFVRAGAIYVKIKTKSGDTYDVTGPVMTRDEIAAVVANRPLIASVVTIPPGFSTTPSSIATLVTDASVGIPLLLTVMDQGPDGVTAEDTGIASDDDDRILALGTPPGVKGKAANSASTAGFSLGLYLDDEYKWSVEAYVLAKPVSTSISAYGRPTYQASPDGDALDVVPFGLEGQKIMSTKLLPPLVLFGRHWQIGSTPLKFYTGVAAMYAMFYDTKATEALNSYVGGGNPGDTTISIKNTFGFGPMVGLKYDVNDNWHVSLNVGSVKLKTTATLVTRNTTINKFTGAIYDYGYQTPPPSVDGLYANSIADTAQVAEFVTARYANNPIVQANGGVTGILGKAVAALRGQDNLGTYVRKTKTELENTLFMLSVGRSF